MGTVTELGWSKILANSIRKDIVSNLEAEGRVFVPMHWPKHSVWFNPPPCCSPTSSAMYLHGVVRVFYERKDPQYPLFCRET